MRSVLDMNCLYVSQLCIQLTRYYATVITCYGSDDVFISLTVSVNRIMIYVNGI